MIEIDGSYGEGGGQILRTSLALSSIIKEPILIRNIRVKRPSPGLKHQHLSVIKAFEKIFKGKATGVEIGSKEVMFIPAEAESGEYMVDIGTAGSTTLLSHALLPALFNSRKNIKLILKGGTDTKWAPTWIHFSKVFVETLKRFGYDIDVDLSRRGFYPLGGGKLEIKIGKNHHFKRIELLSCEGIERIEIYSYSQGIGRNVTERMAASAEEVLSEYKVEKNMVEGQGPPGAVIDCLAYLKGGGVIGSNFIGERGVKAEVVGSNAGKKLLKELNPIRCIDEHMQDQIIPYLAMSGGSVLVGRVTPHTKTNIYVIEKILKKGITIKEKGGRNIISSRG